MLFGSGTLLCADSLVAGNDDGLINLIDIAAARKIVDRSSNTLEDWTYSGAASETLNKLVADIACLKAWEYEGVAMASDGAALGLAGANTRNDSGIGLEFAINLEIASTTLSTISCLAEPLVENESIPTTGVSMPAMS